MNSPSQKGHKELPGNHGSVKKNYYQVIQAVTCHLSFEFGSRELTIPKRSQSIARCLFSKKIYIYIIMLEEAKGHFPLKHGAMGRVLPPKTVETDVYVGPLLHLPSR